MGFRVVSGSWYGNLEQWKLPGIYEGDPNEDLVMGDTESQLLIYCSQARPTVVGLVCNQLSCWPTEYYGNPQTV